jgi:hypothetical protein
MCFLRRIQNNRGPAARTILILVVSLAPVIFAVQNADVVTVDVRSPRLARSTSEHRVDRALVPFSLVIAIVGANRPSWR